MKSSKLINSLDTNNSLNLKKIELLKNIESKEVHNGNNFANSRCCDGFVDLIENADFDELKLIEKKGSFFNDEGKIFCDFLGDNKDELEYFETYFDLFCELKKEHDSVKKIKMLKSEFDWADDDKIKELSEYF